MPGRLSAVAGSFVAAGLVLGMLLDGWLRRHVSPSRERLITLAGIVLLAVALAVLLTVYGDGRHFTCASPDEWVSHAARVRWAPGDPAGGDWLALAIRRGRHAMTGRGLVSRATSATADERSAHDRVGEPTLASTRQAVAGSPIEDELLKGRRMCSR